MNTKNYPSQVEKQELSELPLDTDWETLKANEKAAMQVSKKEVAAIIARSQRQGHSAHIRKATTEDAEQIYQLYQAVARAFPDNIIQQENEVILRYIQETLHASLERGIVLVVVKNEQIVAYLKAFTSEFRRFAHILSDATVIVHPNFIHQRYGALLVMKGLQIIQNKMPHIQMVEVRASPSNEEAIKIYMKLGFKLEGVSNRSRAKSNGTFEEEMVFTLYNLSFNNEALQTYYNHLLNLLLKEQENVLKPFELEIV